ncbi:hypothetical protein PVAND_010764 [Polypedilum vanderplanki]|uniref:FAM20 C-terminal domain-containing protein n=1 Tax=Polypedilum vanderplanki TaxID=319348 RepID=A0A9J6CHU0_POLVA|nr:hypothetical protein PVAND_010764 [Polypedilum vanderplanki]
MIANECHKNHHREVAENCIKSTVNDKSESVVIDDTMLLVLRKKRRAFYHQTCLLSVMAAFTIGLAMGIFFLPLIRLTSANSPTIATNNNIDGKVQMHKYSFNSKSKYNSKANQINNFESAKRPAAAYSSVSFISDDDKYSKIAAAYEPVIEQAAIATEDRNNKSTTDDNSNKMQQSLENSYERENNETLQRIIEDGIYWGQAIEDRIPNGFSKRDTQDWQNYLQGNMTEIIKIEQGCGRMQNRLVTFSDGVKACVRYRQNTDQIQGELFSFFLGRLLNITNLVPSTAAVIDWDSRLWLQVKQHITESQWKTSRPVVFTKWIPDLLPSDIPVQFRPLERHMNRDDIWNMTMSDDDGTNKPSHVLIDRLKTKYDDNGKMKLKKKKKISLNERMYERFVELAQWSDLIVFDYLIANLDRVVNNLYNYQWNADIMAAPAHNLARQKDSQLLVFLDNESGLLHGYRLLKKYEVYHSLLLDELCVFRKSTIEALRHLHENNAGDILNDIFEQITGDKVRDVLPPLPEKSIKILSERIEHVLQQVQKCQDMYSNR